jgi:transcriptional regulator with XRE-family HTH domain
VINEARFFRALGERVRDLRKARKYTQEDMIGFGFSARHWQQIEAGRPITVTTLLRICDTFRIRVDVLVGGLDRGIYRERSRS